MNVILTLRGLRRHWFGLTIGVLLAAAAAVLVMYRVTPGVPPGLEGRGQSTGFASAEILVDTAVSQVAYLGDDKSPYGTASDLRALVPRAHLLASLMATSPFDKQIASAAGVKPGSLTVFAPTGFDPSMNPAARVTRSPESSLLNVAIGGALPIIVLNVQAPDEATARRIVEAATSRLREHVSRTASARGVPQSERLTVELTGEVSSVTVTVRPRRVVAVAVFLACLSLVCLVVVGMPRLLAHWRQHESLEADDEQKSPPAPAVLT